MDKSPIFTGTQVNYCIVCPRKLWLFSHNLDMEHTSETVALGRLIHEQSFKRERKEIMIDRIKIDFSTRDGVVHEVKKSKSVEAAHRMQLLYYLYHLKRKGVLARGVLHYPKLRQTVELELNPENERELQEVLIRVAQIVEQERPPARLEKLSFCQKCSYYEMCYT